MIHVFEDVKHEKLEEAGWHKNNIVSITLQALCCFGPVKVITSTVKRNSWTDLDETPVLTKMFNTHQQWIH